MHMSVRVQISSTAYSFFLQQFTPITNNTVTKLNGVVLMVYIRKTPKNMDYIHKTPYNTWRVAKWINGKYVSFGTFKSLKQAQKHRDICVRNEWDMKLKKRHGLKHISNEKRRGRYYIHRRVNGKVIYYGYFSNILDAIRERDLLIKYNWDMDALWESGEL